MKDTNMSFQDAVTEGQNVLQRIEKDMRTLEGILNAQETLFEDRKCNNRFRKLTRRWQRMSDAVQDWHEDIEDCISTGDPTVQFGGK